MRAIPSFRFGAATVVVIFVVLVMTGCGVSNKPPAQRTLSTADCQASLDSFIRGERQGRSDGRANDLMGTLSRICKSEIKVATEYLAVKSGVEVFGTSSCKVWTERGYKPATIALLKADGLCTKAKKKKKWPEGGLGWNKADKHIGERKQVCGPLKSARETQYGTFVNVGKDYPDRDRFTFVLWDIRLSPIDRGATICAKGVISLYKGVTQMELNSGSDLKIWQ